MHLKSSICYEGQRSASADLEQAIAAQHQEGGHVYCRIRRGVARVDSGWPVLSVCRRIQGTRWTAPPRGSGCAIPCGSCSRPITPGWLAKRRNYVPFVYDDTIHFIAHSNPPDVFRMPAAIDALREDLTVELEFVSAETEPVRWRHGIMCGGTPGVYDAELGGYVTIFHSKMLHQVNGSLPGRMRTYYMGCAVYAARPPFAIQQLSVIPLAGPESYTPSEHTKGWQIVFPVGIALTPEEVTVSYGKNDRGTQLIRFDRSMFAASLQPPVPARWT